MSQNDVLARAAAFIWTNARLLERCRLAFHFEDGDAGDVVRALLPYRNADGGFGNALEPDLRTRASQPVHVEIATEVLVGTGTTEGDLAKSACGFLERHSTPDGAVAPSLPDEISAPTSDGCSLLFCDRAGLGEHVAERMADCVADSRVRVDALRR